MPYINLASHEKLIRYRDNLNHTKPGAAKASLEDTREMLLKDIQQLDEIARSYKQTISTLQTFSDEYQSIHKKVRLGLRKLGMVNVRKINRQY